MPGDPKTETGYITISRANGMAMVDIKDSARDLVVRFTVPLEKYGAVLFSHADVEGELITRKKG